jgi:hypothetical protein
MNNGTPMKRYPGWSNILIGGRMGIKQIIGTAVGALAGFLIGYLGSCVGGTA